MCTSPVEARLKKVGSAMETAHARDYQKKAVQETEASDDDEERGGALHGNISSITSINSILSQHLMGGMSYVLLRCMRYGENQNGCIYNYTFL